MFEITCTIFPCVCLDNSKLWLKVAVNLSIMIELCNVLTGTSVSETLSRDSAIGACVPKKKS